MLLALGGCRKGADDPVLSLNTRKARVAGNWTAVSGTAYTEYSFRNDYSEQVTITNTIDNYRQEQVNYYMGVARLGDSESGEFRYKMQFKKDGSFESSRLYKGLTTFIKGKWNFTGNTGSTKNKSQLVIIPDSMWDDYSRAVYRGNKVRYTYNIKELRNKKMVLFCEYTISYTDHIQVAKEEYTFAQ